MIIQLIIILLFGILGSYFSFYNPKLLSKNIEEISSNKLKQIASLVSVISIILLFFYVNPKTNLDWLEYGFVLIFYFISAIDLYSKIIPNRALLLLLMLGALYHLLNFNIESLWAGAILFTLFSIANLLINRVLGKALLGWGDVKLIGILSFYMGWEILWVIYIAIIISGLLSILGVLLKKITRKSRIPLGVFLFLGYLFLDFIDLNTLLNLTNS